MNSMDMMSPEKVAEMYGGDKRRIGQAAQMGLVDPTVAVMAGMFIDRMRGAAAKESAPQTSVAQEVMAPAAGLAAAQAAPPVESGLAALPVPEEAVPSEYAGGGVVAFAGEDGSLVSSQFGRDIEAWKRNQRESMQATTPGMVGAWNRPLISPEEDELMKLRQIVQQKYGGAGSLIQGYFTSQSPADRERAKDIVSRIPTMSADELRELAGTSAPPRLSTGVTPTATAPVPANAPMTGADLRKADRAEQALRSAPGLTPEQSEANIAAARPPKKIDAEKAATAAPAKEEPAEDALARRKRMLKEAGVSEDPYAEDRRALAELRGKLGEGQKFSDAMSMIRAGTQMLDKKSLGAGLKAAGDIIPEVAKERAATRAEEREFAKIERDLNKAEDAMKRGDVDKALEYEDKAKQRDIQLRGVMAQEKSAARPGQITELFAIQQKARAGDPAAQEFIKNYLGSAKTGQVDERFLLDLWSKMKPNEKLDLQRKGIGYEQWAAGKRAEAAGGGGAGWGELRVR